MKLGLAQIDTRVGDLRGNCRRVLEVASAASAEGADLIVFPELIVTGYPPRDLLLDPAFVEASIAATGQLARDATGLPPIVLGTIVRADLRTPGHPGLHNVAALLAGGRIAATRAKRLLPVYSVFHEPRWFVPGEAAGPVEIAGKRVGLLVCEDLWDEGYPVHPSAELVAAGVDLIVSISASPYRPRVLDERLVHARRPGVPVVYSNLVGANDELIFDGDTFVVDAKGQIVAMLPRFREAMEVIDLNGAAPVEVPHAPLEEDLFTALALGVSDFVYKNHLRSVFLGLSGGVDSALVACIAKEALGPDAVTAVAIPSRHSDPRSTETARELAEGLGIGFEVVPLETLHAAAESTLEPLLDGETGSTTDENVQARLRALVLTAYVNRRGGLLLNTSNKTELALGYSTLYGDMAGTLGVIADLTKPEVYQLARWYNEGRGAIPDFILDRPPSAELRPDQIDPFDYPRVAPIVEALVRDLPPPPEATPEELTRYCRLMRAAEHKRWQFGIGLRVSDRAFGTGRMMPVTRV